MSNHVSTPLTSRRSPPWNLCKYYSARFKRQLIAAKLNIDNGSDGTPVSSTVTHADSLLSSFAGKLPYKVKTASSIGKAMVNDATTLNNYNNGLLTQFCAQ